MAARRIPLNYPDSSTRATNNSRTPNTNLPPFVAKTEIKDPDPSSHLLYDVPLYTPYDATDKVQGATWLTDKLTVKNPLSKSDNKNAATGMTAMTPQGVRENALCVTFRGDGPSGDSILLEGNKQTAILFQGSFYPSRLKTDGAEVTGTLKADAIEAKNISVSGSVDTNPMVKVNFLKTGTDASGSPVWKASGTTGVKKNGYFNIDLDFDTLPADRLPAKIPSSHIDITQDMLPNIPLEKLPPSVMERVTLVNSHKDMLNLTIDDVQNGDAVKINSSSDAEEGYAGKIYIIYDETKLGSDDAFVEFSAGTAATAANADRAKIADKAKALDHPVAINFTGDVSGTLSTDFAETFLDDVELTISIIQKKTIEDIFGVTLE